MPKPSGGTAWPPSRATSARSTTSESCTTTVGACRRTTPKPSGGTAWPPSRATSARSTTSESCTAPAKACRRTTPKPSGGYRLAAEQGDASAQFNLGVRYVTGEGVAQDDAEAVRWYRLAAEQGDASAQFNLGVMYGTGEGVAQDDAEAVRWYRLAAEQGDASAQARIEQMRAEQRILQQQVTPTQASDPTSLFQAQSVKCEWGQGTIVSWNEGRPLLEQGSFGKDAEIIFDSIDTQVGTARIIGNASAGDISVVETPVGLTFIEQATFGGMNFTTVFAHFVEPENVALAAVTSRHLSFASPFPSQYHGTCVILQ